MAEVRGVEFVDGYDGYARVVQLALPGMEPPPASRRGIVNPVMSSASRGRFARRIAEYHRAWTRKRGTRFIVLTVPSEWVGVGEPYQEAWDGWRSKLRTLMDGVRRDCVNLVLVWGVEVQERGAPHYNLLGSCDCKRYGRGWACRLNSLTEDWVRLTGHAGSSVEDRERAQLSRALRRDPAALIVYLTTEVGKAYQKMAPVFRPGRWWGVVTSGRGVLLASEFKVEEVLDVRKLREVWERVQLQFAVPLRSWWLGVCAKALLGKASIGDVCRVLAAGRERAKRATSRLAAISSEYTFASRALYRLQVRFLEPEDILAPPVWAEG